MWMLQLKSKVYSDEQIEKYKEWVDDISGLTESQCNELDDYLIDTYDVRYGLI